MFNFLENAPSKTGNPSGGGRGNNPPGNRISNSAGWPSTTGGKSGGGRDNAPSRK